MAVAAANGTEAPRQDSDRTSAKPSRYSETCRSVKRKNTGLLESGVQAMRRLFCATDAVIM